MREVCGEVFVLKPLVFTFQIVAVGWAAERICADVGFQDY